MKFLLVCTLVFSCNVLFSQEGEKSENISLSHHKLIADSLSKGSYKDIKTTYQTFYQYEELATLYAQTYIRKAKDESNTIELANGYDMICKYNFANYDIATAYVDSIIHITKNLKDKNYPSRGYLNKGNLLTNVKKYKEALAHYLIAEKHALENNNIVHQLAIKHNIARLKHTLNKHQEALSVYKKNLNFLKNNKIEYAYEHIYIGSMLGMAESYNKLKKIDSADIYIQKAINECYRAKNFYYLENLLLASGINYTLKKNHQIALDTLFKAEEILPDSWSVPTKPICHTYIGKNLYMLDRKPEALNFLTKVDSAITASNYIPEVREAFEILISHYKAEKDNKNQLRLLEKLIVLDSMTYQTHRSLNIEIINQYDTEILKKDRKALLDKLAIQEQDYWAGNITILITISILSLLLLLWFYKKHKRHKETVQVILQEKQQILKNTIPKIRPKKEKKLSDELKSELLEKLKSFEKNKKFLDQDLSLSSTAKQLKTNSTYLSKIINETYGKNFANYINELRISHTIEKLHNDPKYRLYSIIALAKEVGFNNSKSFSRAFLRKTGEQPSTFIKKLLPAKNK